LKNIKSDKYFPFTFSLYFKFSTDFTSSEKDEDKNKRREADNWALSARS